MKYLAAALVLIAMAWTYNLSMSDRERTLEQRKEIESQVQAIITAHVKNKRPAVTDVVFQRLYTETVKPNEQVRARFVYVIKEPMANGETVAQSFDGAVDLASPDGGKTWNWAGEAVTSPGVEFQKGSYVRAHAKDANDDTPVDDAGSVDTSAASTSAPKVRARARK